MRAPTAFVFRLLFPGTSAYTVTDSNTDSSFLRSTTSDCTRLQVRLHHPAERVHFHSLNTPFSVRQLEMTFQNPGLLEQTG